MSRILKISIFQVFELFMFETTQIILTKLINHRKRDTQTVWGINGKICLWRDLIRIHILIRNCCIKNTMWEKTNIHSILIRLIAAVHVHFSLDPLWKKATKEMVGMFDTRSSAKSDCDENHTKVASHTNPETFSIEDVFFTGIVRVKAGLPEPFLANNNRQLCTHILDLDRLAKVKKIRKWSMKIIPSYFPAWYTWYKIWFISYERTIVFDFCKSHFIPAVECLMDYKKYQKYDNYYTTWSI